jgi:hypothetical protein
LRHLRAAAHEIEAWLLADSEQLATFLAVSQAQIPEPPDLLADPEEQLLNLARKSTHPRQGEGMLPCERSGTAVGPLHAIWLAEFVIHHW